MKLTQEINGALARIQSEDHVVHKGLREVLFESVGPVFDQHEQFFPIRPSSALKPLRDIFYDLKNFYNPGSIPKADFEPKTKLIFQFGHVTETILKKLTSHKFEVLFEQQRVKYGELEDKDGTKISLTGSIDWAMRLDSTSSPLTLCDAKSIGEYPFKTAPKEANIAQMQLYMHSDWGRANSVNSAILIYFNKNNSDIKCIEIPYDANLATKLLQRLQLAFEYYKKDEVPPREYLAGCDWQADYSPYVEYDNQEFLPEAPRNVVLVEQYFKPSKYVKDDIRYHAQTYGNQIAQYYDKKVSLQFIDKKLTLQIGV